MSSYFQLTICLWSSLYPTEGLTKTWQLTCLHPQGKASRSLPTFFPCFSKDLYYQLVLAAFGKPDLSLSNGRSACLTAWQGGEAIELPAYTSDLPSLCQSKKIIEEIVNSVWD